MVERAGRRPVLLVPLRRAEPLEVEPPRLPHRGGRAAAAVTSLHGREQEELLPLSSVRPRRRSHSRTLGAGELGAPRRASSRTSHSPLSVGAAAHEVPQLDCLTSWLVVAKQMH